jgi:hypothetical protein
LNTGAFLMPFTRLLSICFLLLLIGQSAAKQNAGPSPPWEFGLPDATALRIIDPGEKHWIHDELGYNIILWDVDPLDWKRPGPSIVCDRIIRETRPGSIILSHDIHPGTIEAMSSTFDQLQAKIQIRDCLGVD